MPIAISQGASRSVLAGAVAHIQTEIASGGRVAVHCQGGNGRTGMVSGRLPHEVSQHVGQESDQLREVLQAAVHRNKQRSGEFEDI